MVSVCLPSTLLSSLVWQVLTFPFSWASNTPSVTTIINSNKITKIARAIFTRLTKKPRTSRLETAKYSLAMFDVHRRVRQMWYQLEEKLSVELRIGDSDNHRTRSVKRTNEAEIYNSWSNVPWFEVTTCRRCGTEKVADVSHIIHDRLIS